MGCKSTPLDRKFAARLERLDQSRNIIGKIFQRERGRSRHFERRGTLSGSPGVRSYRATITILGADHLRRFLISFRVAALSCRRLRQNDEVEKRKDDIARACSKAYVVLTVLPAQRVLP